MKKNYEDKLISIVTPVYNAAPFLTQTIEAVRSQSYPHWEWLLVDDASQDESTAIIQAVQTQDSRIKLISLKENSGAAVARNKGLEAARGRYIAFVDSDDYWDKYKLAEQLEFMIKNHYEFTYTNFASIDEEGDIIKENITLPLELDYYALLKNTAIACSTVMIDRETVGDFRMPLVRKGQDTATWLKLLRENEGLSAHGLDKVLNYYRQVEGSISSDRIGALKRTWHTYRHLEKLPLIKSIYFFSHYVFQAVKRRL